MGWTIEREGGKEQRWIGHERAQKRRGLVAGYFVRVQGVGNGSGREMGGGLDGLL